MAINHVRELIVDLIEEESLEAFHKDCSVTDKLFTTMENTSDPEHVYGMAVAWATSVLKLARTEVRLLSAVLPLYQAELEELVSKISPLIQRREDARMAVHEFRGPDNDVRPLSMKQDPQVAKDKREAREYAKTVSMEVLAELRPIQAEAEEVQRDVGAIKLLLRALDVFVNKRFPIPQRTPRLRGQSTGPSGVDPVASFAEKYVAAMGSRNKVAAEAKARQALRAHPTNRFDRHGQVIVH